MNIDQIISTYSPSTSQGTKKSGDSMGKDDFLKLLVTQLQKQDPMNPEDPTQFTSQLTQYSSLEQLVNVNTNLQGLTDQQLASTQLTATSYIGKVVNVSGNTLNVSQGSATAGHYSLPADSAVTSLEVYDASGKLINTISLGSQKTGSHDFTWTGQNTSGQTVADGTYHFTLTAQDATGQAIDTTTSVTGTVNGVSFENGKTQLQVGGSSYSLSDLLSVSAAA